MVNPLEQRGYVKLLEALTRTNDDPPLDHYPHFITQHCNSCGRITDQTVMGVLRINPRRPSHEEKTRIVGCMCALCKGMNEYKYCAPGEEIVFKRLRKT